MVVVLVETGTSVLVELFVATDAAVVDVDRGWCCAEAFFVAEHPQTGATNVNPSVTIVLRLSTSESCHLRSHQAMRGRRAGRISSPAGGPVPPDPEAPADSPRASGSPV